MRPGSSTLLIVLTAASVAAAQDASCPNAGFQAQLMTPPALQIPRDAGLVVGLFPGGTSPDLPPVTLTRPRRETGLTSQRIAPGLFRLSPGAERLHGRWTVTGLAGASPPLVFGRPGIGAAPTQPRLERVERYLVAGAEGSRTEVRAHLAFPIPERVVALIVYWGDDAEPDLFARAIPTSRQLVIYASTGRCSELPPGATAPPSEGDVRVAFVDQYGQTSPPSEPARLGR